MYGGLGMGGYWWVHGCGGGFNGRRIFGQVGGMHELGSAIDATRAVGAARYLVCKPRCRGCACMAGWAWGATAADT